jgi:hypothetical protein
VSKSDSFDFEAYAREMMQKLAEREEHNKLVLEMVQKLVERQAEDLRRRQVEALPFLLLPPRGQA